MRYRPTNDRPTNQPTDTAYYRDARTHLKKRGELQKEIEGKCESNCELKMKGKKGPPKDKQEEEKNSTSELGTNKDE